MKFKLFLFIISVFCFQVSFPQSRGNLGRERLVDMLELPAYNTKKGNEQVVVKYRHTVSFNPKYRIPNWVAWKQTIDHYQPNFPRVDGFNNDPDINGCAWWEDYKENGKNIQRGHMCPHQVSSWSKEARDCVDYMSNIAPQYARVNTSSGLWNKLEKACKKWNNDNFVELYIICGPILKNGDSEIYDFIEPKKITGASTNPIAIPKKFFKAILGKDRAGNYFGIAYVINNDASLKGYYTSIDYIEELTGYDLFHNLPDHIENAVEADVKEYKWPNCSIDGKCSRKW